MDFRQLNYFVAVAQALSFSRAARNLHISQPPLSQQIKLLERDLGVQLFDRSRRAVELTHAGTLFYAQAVGILERYASAKELCAWSADGRAGKLRIAFTASVPIFEAFPRLIHSFHAAYPRIEMDLLHMSTGEQLVALDDQQIDVGFLRPSLNFRAASTMDVLDLWRDELVLATAKCDEGDLQDGSVNLGDYARRDFILFPQALGCGLFAHIVALTTESGFSPRIVQEARENSTTLALVAAGLGISIVPDTYACVAPPGVQFRRIESPNAKSKIVLASARNHETASLGLFLEHVRVFLKRCTL
ncbi:MAG TPA: LysR family transcriptional regulator [Paralcaligenes sp.]